MAERQNIGRFFAAMQASTCRRGMRPASAISSSSLRYTASSVGPRRKLRSPLQKAAVLACVNRRAHRNVATYVSRPHLGRILAISAILDGISAAVGLLAVAQHVALQRARVEGVGLAHHVATCVHHAAPQRARLVPSRVARICAEDEEQRQRGHRHGEGHGWQAPRAPEQTRRAPSLSTSLG